VTDKQTLLPIAILFIILMLLLSGCGYSSADHWSDIVPGSTPFVMVPETDTSIDEMLSAPYMPLFDDITPSAFQLSSNIEDMSPDMVRVEALLLFPDTANDWQPVWIIQKVNGLNNLLKSAYQRRFEQNRYNFNNHTVEKLFISDREYFTIEIGNWMIFSESSLAIENIIRTADGEEPAIVLDQSKAVPGTVIMNTVSIEKWVQQIAQVMYRPSLMNLFNGGGAVSLSFSSDEGADWAWQLKGVMDIQNDRSLLLRSISSERGDFTLDRYISINTAGFGIMRLEPRMVPPDDLTTESEADRYIDANPDIWQNIAGELDDEVAFATFAESGAGSTSEYLFLRRINNAGEIRSQLNRLANENLIIRDGNTYSVNSSWLSSLFGSELNPMNDFFVTVYNNVAAMSLRKGLAESVGGDANRRRVMYYDDDYMQIKGSLSNTLSSIFYMDASRFGTYIQPWLYPQNYFNTLTAALDQFVITTERQAGSSELTLSLTSFERERVDQPFRENWVFPIGGADITGPAVLADISGSARNEVVFSTENGSVYALATDGTTVLQVNTGSDTPIGSPVVYDWYGNNQNVIMQAAGSRIYAWNSSGTVLPNFPINLSELITTPLTIMDVTRNGVAEIIVATSDRRMHILNARGEALNGWPQSLNSVVSSRPLIAEINGQRSVFAFAENALHSWEINGTRRNGYPVFLPSQMAGAPAKHNQHIIGAGLDGNIYSVGLESLFSDTLSSTHASDSMYVQSLQISNSSLNATPSSHSVLMRDDEGFYREQLILSQSSNGSVFMHNSEGILRFTKTMGQPGSGSFAPLVTDLDLNLRIDVVALADFGRLYAWDILSGERLYDLPTNGMRHIVVEDLTGNGNNEIIAQTREGLRSWTIIRTRRDVASD
jgi:hypothetical protein